MAGRKHPKETVRRHVSLYHYMMESQAWKSLGCIPRAVYVDIAKRYYGKNNGRIGYSIRCAVDELHIKRGIDAGP